MIGARNRDTTFTKGVLLSFLGAVLIIFYFVPLAPLVLGLGLLFPGLVWICLATRRFQASEREAHG